MSLTDEALPAVFSPDFTVDPYPRLEQLRRDDPVHWVPDHSAWFVTRYEDIRFLLGGGEGVTPDARAGAHYVPPPPGTYLAWLAEHSLFALDMTDHRRARRLVTTALTPRAIARMDDQILEVVERFAAPLMGCSLVVDVMAEFTDVIPGTVISRLTGIPPNDGDEARFRTLAKPVVTNALPFAPDGSAELAETALVELTAWVRELAEERREAPKDDLISDLVTTHDMGDQMTNDEIVMMVAGLILAGTETTALGGMVTVMTMLDHREVFEKIRSDSSLIPPAVLEIVRFGMGGPGTLPRYATHDFELHGKHIRRGDMLMLSFGGANRDPDVFDNPHEFDITRDHSKLLTFGYGAHHCLGAHLAKAEMGAMLHSICRFLPVHAEIRFESMEFRQLGGFPRPMSLPIDFGQ
jgi:cytochrome P450